MGFTQPWGHTPLTWPRAGAICPRAGYRPGPGWGDWRGSGSGDQWGGEMMQQTVTRTALPGATGPRASLNVRVTWPQESKDQVKVRAGWG